MDDPYASLGVSRKATAAEIKSAYRRIARETHPDLQGGSARHVMRFQAATDAYAVLADPVQRQRFDDSGAVDEGRVLATRADIFAAMAYARSMASAVTTDAEAAALKGLDRVIGWLDGL